MHLLKADFSLTQYKSITGSKDVALKGYSLCS